ncbi:MAG: phage gp6-like head-tail connector protein [Rickettsiaceae bacterium]|nr:MAG: phage gp6-like head-tail connector protein [Rickettsiaceae bacterium]
MFKKNSFEVTKYKAQKIWSIEQVKNYLRVSHSYDDDLIKNLIAAAISTAESFTGFCLIAREITFISNLNKMKFELEYSPIKKLVSIHTQRNSDLFELNDNQYYVDLKRSLFYLKEPLYQQELMLKYIAGFKASEIPASVKQGILLHTCEMYDREGESNSVLSNENKNLYLPYKKIRI